VRLLSPSSLSVGSRSRGSDRFIYRTGTSQSEPHRSHNILRFKSSIHPNRYHPIRSSHASALDLKQIRIEILNQIRFQTSKIHIFWSLHPKIANNISLESLGSLESSSTIKSYILWDQFETIFKLESNPLSACLNHIFCSGCPKITNL
jgi:hypothetical protein